MGTKEPLKTTKFTSLLYSDVRVSNKDLNNKDKINDNYKRLIRKNPHTVKFTDFSEKKYSSKKPIMTKEQRNLLKTFLKENVKENKKTIAKNLIGIFMENKRNSIRESIMRKSTKSKLENPVFKPA